MTCYYASHRVVAILLQLLVFIESGLGLPSFTIYKQPASNPRQASSPQRSLPPANNVVGYKKANFPVWNVSQPIIFSFKDEFTDEQKRRVRQAIALWSAQTCVQYAEMPYDPQRTDAIYMQLANAHYNPDGADANDQDPSTRTTAIDLSNSVLSTDWGIGATAHEIGHSLGLDHQHQRPDRELNIILENIDPEFSFAFGQISRMMIEGTPYDVMSVMHYRGDAFSKDDHKFVTMQTFDGDQEGILGIGQFSGPSFNDFRIVNRRYKCKDVKCKKQPLPRPCLNRGYQNPNDCDKCLCPPGTAGDFCDQVEKAVGFKKPCGGVVELEPCTSKTLTLPSYPYQYPYGASCTWVINSTSSSLIFGFEDGPRLQCYHNLASGECIDYLEIRSNFSRLDIPGKFFCGCSQTKGRKIATPEGVAMVRFVSLPENHHSWSERNNGFRLTVFAMCNPQLETAGRKVRKAAKAQRLEDCKVARSGYDANDPSAPFCGGINGPTGIAQSSSVHLPVSANDLLASSPTDYETFSYDISTQESLVRARLFADASTLSSSVSMAPALILTACLRFLATFFV